MRKETTTPGEYYHIFNRGINKNDIFYNDLDRLRFLFLITHLQSAVSFKNISREIKLLVQSRALHSCVDKEIIAEICKERFIELVAFALMPNHFHLLIREVQENGIPQYMHKILTAYSKYINIKHEKDGHVLQGPYRIVHVDNNEQLTYLSAYIHRNPRDLQAWTNKEISYPWSSYQDFARENRWEELLNPSIVLNQFTTKKSYREFVDTSTAKLKVSDSAIKDLFLE